MPFLHVEKGENEGQLIPLNQDKIVLGRSPDCDAIISKKEAVSRWHAQILQVNGGYFIEDLRSRNKTFVNEKELTPLTRVPLKHKDSIRICTFQATFYTSSIDEFPGDDSSVFEAMLNSKSDHSLATQPAAKLAELLEITAKLSKTLQLDAQLPEVAEGLLRLFPQADRCFLILTEPATGHLQPKVVRARAGIDDSIARFSYSIVRQCVQSAQAILMREEDKKTQDNVLGTYIRSVMCVPLCPSEGPPIGVIQLDTQDAAKRFTEDDLRLLWGVGYQASIAMENTRYQELRVAQARMKNELELARQVQRAFLPRALPQLTGYEFYAYYEAALQVGGDYYDFIPLSETKLAVTVGDVAGKGMPAALLMARLSSEARSCLLSEHDPIAAVSRLNSLLCPITGPMDRFVTLVVAVLDAAEHTVTLVNAGHPAPLMYRSAERAFAKAIPAADNGPLLGIDDACRYQSYQLPVEPGDYLLLYSDGVTDAQSVSGKSFRLAGIQDASEKDAWSTPGLLGERIVKAVHRHALGGAQYDDITLLCLGRPATKS